ncbi:MAG: hypothetical protein IPK83_19915 [Planctomycetes bacterium]|nr:hypothetical protein [Planctomycetota bacterium]
MLMRGRMFRWMLVAGVCFGSMGAGAVRASGPKDALKLIPEDAWGFVMLRSIGTIDERATYLQQLLNLPIPGQVTPMAMMMLQIMPNEENPIDMSSPVCIVMMDVQKFGAAEGAPMPDPSSAAVAIIPAKNAEGLIKKFGGEEAKDGVSKCTISNQEVYGAIKDKFVILGKNQDCVTRVLKSTKNAEGSVAAARVKVLSDSDIYVSVSVGSVVTAYRDMISNFIMGMGQTMGQNPADLKKLQDMMEQLNAFDLAINISKEGLAIRYLMDAKKGTDLEKMMQDSKNADGPLLAQLPKEKYLLAGGAKGGYSEHAAKFGDPNVVGNLLRQIHAEGVDERPSRQSMPSCSRS